MQETFITNILRKPAWILFLLSWSFYLVGLFLYSQFVWDDNTYLMGFQGTNFDEYISNIRKMDYLRYVFSPIWILGISAAIWMLIKTGLLFLRIDISTILLFKIIFLGLSFISLPFWVKSVWLILFSESYTPDMVKYFYPGSIVPFLDISEIREIVISTIANINIYHLGFMLLTSWLISQNTNLKQLQSFTLLFFTYGIGIILLRCLILVVIL